MSVYKLIVDSGDRIIVVMVWKHWLERKDRV